MTLTELRYLTTLAQEGNFRRAAEKCFVTQPALSLGIKSLERALGLSLFERTTGKVQVTIAGAKIVAQAQRVLNEVAQLHSIAQHSHDPLSGVLKLGVIHTIGPYMLPELVPALKKIAPNLRLQIDESTTAHLQTRLQTGAIELAILALPFAAPGLQVRALYDEVFEVLVPKTHALAKTKEIKRSDLQHQTVLLLDEGHCFANQVAKACPGLHPMREIQTGNSLETVRNMVASGMGITVLPASANHARYRNPLLKAIPFAQPMPMRRVALAWRTAYTRTEVIQVIQQAIFNAHNPAWQPVQKIE